MREQTGSHYCPVFILKFVHCYSKDVVSTKEQNRERGTSMGNGKLNKTTKQRIGNEVIEWLARSKWDFVPIFHFLFPVLSPPPFFAPVPHFSNTLQQLFKNRFSTCTDKQLFRLWNVTFEVTAILRNMMGGLMYFVQYPLTLFDGAWCWICWCVFKASESLRVWYHNGNITIPLIYQISCVKRKRPCFIIEKKTVLFFSVGTCYTLVGFSLKAGLHLSTFCH